MSRWRQRPDAPARLRGRRGVERRARFLEAHPLCVHCEAATPRRVSAATVVDHIKPLAQGGADDASNLQALCSECSRRKSIEERGMRYRPRIGVDGRPVK